MDADEQVRKWVAGESVHADQCCPDFSCCRPEFQAPQEERDRFGVAHFKGDEKTTFELLGVFLSRAMRIHSEKKIHIAGQSPLE